MRLVTGPLRGVLVAVACTLLASVHTTDARPASPNDSRVAAGSAAPAARVKSRSDASRAPASGPARLASVRALEDPPINDVCAGAIEIPCGNISLSGDSYLATDDYDFPDSTMSCTGWKARGRDVVYKVNALAGDSLWVRYTIIGADASIYLVTNCADVQTSCVAGADLMDLGEMEELKYGFAAPGTYYLILDAHEIDGNGQWTLAGQFLSCGLTPPPNDRCEIATPIYCGPFFFSGTTVSAFNDYTFPSAGSCAGSTSQGRDVAYRLEITAGDSLHAAYTSTANGVMYIIGECSTGTSLCYAGVNATGVGGTETLDYRFTFTGIYYLILDSEGSETFGTFSLSGTRVCGLAQPSNDQCTTPEFLPCGPINLTGSTYYAVDDYRPSQCTPYGAALGPDVTYLITASAGDSIWLDYRFPHVGGQPDVDPVVYLWRTCNSLDSTCVIGVDNGTSAETEYLRYKFTEQGSYLLILDSYEAGTTGNWIATGELICPAIAGVDDHPRRSAELRLGSAVPNPFARMSMVRFSLPEQGRAMLRVYDLAGRVVRTLVDAELPPGEHSATWDARDESGARVAAGTYYVRLVAGGRVAFRKLIFVR